MKYIIELEDIEQCMSDLYKLEQAYFSESHVQEADTLRKSMDKLWNSLVRAL